MHTTICQKAWWWVKMTLVLLLKHLFDLSLFNNVTHRCVSHRCPNLLSLSLAGCGHITDQDVISTLQSCRKLRCLHLENCVRITDCSLEAVVAHGDSLEEVKVDFCRNITQAGLQAVREKRPSIQLSAERSADMIPDRKPEGMVPLRSALQKLLLFSWGKRFHTEPLELSFTVMLLLWYLYLIEVGGVF